MNAINIVYEFMASLSCSLINLEFAKYHYDDVIFPPLESVPRKFAVLKRNEWMVEEADLVIA